MACIVAEFKLIERTNGKKQSEGQTGRNSLRFNNMCCRLSDESAIATQDSNCFLTSIFPLVLLVILQNPSNNLLDLYLVEIRRYKLSFFAKEVTKTSHAGVRPFSQNFEKPLREAQNFLGAETRHIIG